MRNMQDMQREMQEMRMRAAQQELRSESLLMKQRIFAYGLAHAMSMQAYETMSAIELSAKGQHS